MYLYYTVYILTPHITCVYVNDNDFLTRRRGVDYVRFRRGYWTSGKRLDPKTVTLLYMIYLDRGRQQQQKRDGEQCERRRLLTPAFSYRGSVFVRAVVPSRTTTSLGRPPRPSWSPYPFAATARAVVSVGVGGASHDDGFFGCTCSRCRGPRYSATRVNGDEKITTVPAVSPAASAADSAACVTSTYSGGGHERWRNHVNNYSVGFFFFFLI